jgi:hypothetical protein
MIDLKDFLIKENINHSKMMEVTQGLLSNDAATIASCIGIIKENIPSKNKCKTISKFEYDTHDWYIVFTPDRNGGSDNIMFGHCIGSNHWVYYTEGNMIKKRVESWKNIKYQLSPRSNDVYISTLELALIFKDIEMKLIEQ